jgi:hypothetical protein
MIDIHEDEFVISDHPLIKGRNIAMGWWTMGSGENIRIKDMRDNHLNRTINYLKDKIIAERDRPEPDNEDINWTAFMLMQMIDERDERARAHTDLIDDIIRRV